MNLPNKLTLLRVILIPFFLVMMYVDAIPLHFLWALVIFAAASLTDMLDGKIARARGLVTNFGKFLDPLADKVLVITALTVFVELKEFRMSAIPLVIIIAREFMVSGLRLLAAEEGVVIAAGIWGKLKTAFTMVTIVGVISAVRPSFLAGPSTSFAHSANEHLSGFGAGSFASSATSFSPSTITSQFCR